MNLILHLPPETEATLKEQAAALGKAPEELARVMLEEWLTAHSHPLLSDVPTSPNPVSPQQRIANFRKWAEGHRRLEHEADDSRESIYEGRGE